MFARTIVALFVAVAALSVSAGQSLCHFEH
jgi:hypothetical protein